MKRALLAACGLALAVSAPAVAQVVSFDTISNLGSINVPAGGGSLASTGNRQIGQALTLAAAAGSSITGFDTALLNNTGAAITLTSLELRYWIWGTASLAVTGTTPAFSNLLQNGTVTFTLAPTGLTAASNTFFWITGNGTQAGGGVAGVTLTTAIPVSTNQTIGFVQQWWGSTTGGAPAPIGGLTGLISGGTTAVAPSVGSNPFSAPGTPQGYYRSAGAETNGNFLGSSQRNIGANTNQLLRVWTVPTPGAAALLGLGGLIAGRRRRA